VPYAGFGWGNAVGKNKRLGVSFELGVVFQGSPDIELESTGGALSSSPALQAEIAKEEKKIEDDIDDFEYYPVIALGISYKF